MNWTVISNLGWLATAVLAFIVWGIQRQTEKVAADKLFIKDEEKDAIIKRIAEYDARVEHIVRAALNEFEVRMFLRINGTYVRSKESDLRFDALHASLRRIESACSDRCIQ